MANLYITEQHSILRKTGNRLILEKDDQVLLDVQCHKIDAVLIFGNVQFTTQAVNELFDQGIELSILSRNGRLKGQISSPFTKNIDLRLMQFKQYWDDAFRLEISKIILGGKVHNSLNFIRRFAYNHPEIGLNEEMAAIRKQQDMIAKASDLARLFGIEGAAAKSHFKALGKMVLKAFRFEHRSRRPPRDPVNALLSLSYTMIYNEIASLLDGLGFDPYLGYFHHPDYGRASLAADLVEEFRTPVGDVLTLNLINKGVFKADDFYPSVHGGTLLKRESLKRYFAEYEAFLNRGSDHKRIPGKTTLRKAFRRQAEAMARAVQDQAAYTPFTLEV